MASPDNSLKELCFKETRKLGWYQEEGEVESKIVLSSVQKWKK